MNRCLRTFAVLFAAFASALSVSAQGYVFEGCATMGPSDLYATRDMAGSPDGALYVVGSYSTGTFAIGGQSVSTDADDAVYLARFTADLSLDWLINLADNPNFIESTPMSTLDVDHQGNVVVGIGFLDTLQLFGSDLVPENGDGIVLMKLDPSGEPLWWQEINAKRIGKQGVAFDPEGNVLITGEANEGMFTAKYSTAGDLVWWTPSSGNAGSSLPWSVCADTLGNVYTIGMLPGGGGVFGSLEVDFPVGCFVVGYAAKFSASGDALWVRYVYSLTFAQYTVFNAVACHGGGIFLGGEYSDNLLRFSNGGGTHGPQTAGSPRSFLARYDAVGTLQWVRIPSYITYGADGAMSLTVDAGAEHILYSFSGIIDHGLGNVVGQGSNAVLLERADQDGGPTTAFSIDGTAMEAGNHIIKHMGHLYVLGATNGFPLASPGGCSVTQGSNMFVMRFLDEGVGLSEFEEGPALHIYPNPSDGVFNAQVPHYAERITITDPLGRVVLQQRIRWADGGVRIDLGGVPGGVYVAHVDGTGASLSARVQVLAR